MSEIIMQGGNSLNNATKNNHPHRSDFTIKKPLAFTPRFGEITPFISMRAEADDSLRLHTQFDLRTFSLQSPLMKNLRMHKNYFQVPMEAILPFNWKSKIYPNPTVGDDVPEDAYTYGDYSFLLTELSQTEFDSPDVATGFEPSRKNELLTMLFYWLRCVDITFSSNSLPNLLGYGFPIVDFNWGAVDQSIFNHPTLCVIESLDGSIQEEFRLNEIGLRTFLSLITDNRCKIYISLDKLNVLVPGWENTYASLYSLYQTVRRDLSAATSKGVMKCDLAKIYAYQLVCAQFYTNDKVDFLYSSELWRENFHSLAFNNVSETFAYNGKSVLYDWLSYGLLSRHKPVLSTTYDSYQSYFYYTELFGYRRSLKYEDYFTGSRPRPLAVGNTDVQVSAGNSVSVVDISRSIQFQRFLNQVNRTGRKFSNYITGLFGQVPDKDWHDPIYLGATSEVVYGSETENTGEAQMTQANNITTNLHCNSNRFEFQVDIDRPSIIIGCISFDIERFYTSASERENYYRDRFDMFNPYMQYIGDQSLMLKELNRERAVDSQGTDKTFGYSTRYLEMKMSFPRACGAFITDALPSWLFTNVDIVDHISPEFIRSNPSEFDKYYLNGVGSKTDNYFHFICVAYNTVSSKRPLVVNPQILG